MLKSTFKNLNLDTKSILSKDEQRGIMGGLAGAFADCGVGDRVFCEGGTSCSSVDYDGCYCTGPSGQIVSAASCQKDIPLPIA